MTPHYPPGLRAAIRYAPRPISAYRASAQHVAYGPATSKLLTTPGAWNLAWLSHDFEATLMHPDPHFTVNVRRTVQMKLDGSGLDLSMRPISGVVESLLRLPAPRFVHLIKQHAVLKQLPMYLAYGPAWLRTIEERSYVCQVEAGRDDAIADVSLARAVLEGIFGTLSG